MTDREKAIVMAYTGYTMLTGDKLGIFYDYVTEKLGRSIMTHELAYDEVADEIKRAATDDFYALCMRDDTAMEAPTVNGWISVKDRLPERKWIDYLVATKIQTDGTRGFNIAWVNDDNGVWKSNDEWICDGREIVTHWIPLPEPPKEVSEDD